MYFHEPVFRVILDRFPATLLLTGTALLAGAAAGTLGGVMAARWAGRPADTAISVLSLLGYSLSGYSLPGFWVGQLLILLFAVQLGWLPSGGITAARQSYTGGAHVLDLLEHLVLPAATLSVFVTTMIARLTRAATIEAMGQDFMLVAAAKGVSPRRLLWHHAFRNAAVTTVTVIGLEMGAVLAGIVAVGTLLAPLLTQQAPLALGLDMLAPPDWAHPFGTDDLGRDTFARVLYGGRVALEVGLVSAGISVVFGTGVGMLAGLFGGAVDEALMRLTEVFQILPRLLVAVVVVSLLGAGLRNEVLVIGLLSWPATARIVRGRVGIIRHAEFIAAAALSGASPMRVALRHVLPNIAGFLTGQRDAADSLRHPVRGTPVAPGAG